MREHKRWEVGRSFALLFSKDNQLVRKKIQNGPKHLPAALLYSANTQAGMYAKYSKEARSSKIKRRRTTHILRALGIILWLRETRISHTHQLLSRKLWGASFCTWTLSNRSAAQAYTMDNGLLHIGTGGSRDGGVVGGQGSSKTNPPILLPLSLLPVDVSTRPRSSLWSSGMAWDPARLHRNPRHSKRQCTATVGPTDQTIALARQHSRNQKISTLSSHTPKCHRRTLPDSTALAAPPTTAITQRDTIVSSCTQPSTGKVAYSLPPSAPPPFGPRRG